MAYSAAMTEERTGVYEFVCDHLIPGCTYKDRDERNEEVLERALDHFRVHHTMHHFDEPLDETLKRTGIQFIRPA